MSGGSQKRKDAEAAAPESGATEGASGGEPRALEGDGASFVADVPVVVRVEMGRVAMTLGELAAIRAGTVLELRKDPRAPVALMVEDRIVGTGELVTVEGELGVRILSLG